MTRRQLISRIASDYKGKLILPDANVLLLYLAVLADERLITHKRLQCFDYADFLFLRALCENFQTIVTSPNILTEVSNLLGNEKNEYRRKILGESFEPVHSFGEQYVKTSVAIKNTHFGLLGLSDVSILETATKETLIVTSDATLYLVLHSRGLKVLNINHVRPYYLQN